MLQTEQSFTSLLTQVDFDFLIGYSIPGAKLNVLSPFFDILYVITEEPSNLFLPDAELFVLTCCVI